MPRTLTRSITLLHATALVAGTIIGASIFVQPSAIVGAVPSIGAVYVVWIVAGVLAGSDYPHQIGSIPRMKESLSALRVSDGERKSILGTNAATLYRLGAARAVA